MAIRQYDLSIDIKREIYERIKVKPQDTGNRLKVRLSEDGAPKDLTGNTVRFCAKKSDGTGVYTVAEKVDEKNGVVLINLDNQATAVTGLVACEIEIEQKDVYITTFTFYLDVVDKINDGKFIESTNEFAELILAMKATKKATAECEAQTLNMQDKINKAIVNMNKETEDSINHMKYTIDQQEQELVKQAVKVGEQITKATQDCIDTMTQKYSEERDRVTAVIEEHKNEKQEIKDALDSSLMKVERAVFDKIQNEHLMKLDVEVAVLRDTTARDMLFNVFYEKLDTLDDIKVIEGVFNSEQRRFEI